MKKAKKRELLYINSYPLSSWWFEITIF